MSYLAYFAPGACSRVVLTALEHVAVSYDCKAIVLANKEQFLPSFKALNPKGKVPCLVTPDGILTEVIAICHYLHQRFPEANLLPSRSYAQAQTMALLSWCATTLHPCIYRIRMTGRIHPHKEQHDVIKRAALEELRQQLYVAEQHLSDGKTWFMGDCWYIADAYFLWVWQRAQQAGIQAKDWPAIARWGALCESYPSWQQALVREEIKYSSI